MADTLTTIAVNHIPKDRLASALPGVGVSQTVQADGSLLIQLGDNVTDGYVTPWPVATTMPAGDMVGVLILAPDDGLVPAGGASVTLPSGDPLIWLRGSTSGYAHAIAVRAPDLTSARLHVPAGGRPLTILKVGLFDLPSWLAMQQRGVLYFDGGGITYAASDGYTLPPATATTLGGVKIDTSTLSITSDGLLSALQQRIPVASTDRLGGIKPGRGLRTAADGTTSVRLGRNLDYDANGAIEAPDIQAPDMSDYPTKSELTSRLDSYYTKELADATFQKKDSSGGGSTDPDQPSATGKAVGGNLWMRQQSNVALGGDGQFHRIAFSHQEQWGGAETNDYHISAPVEGVYAVSATYTIHQTAGKLGFQLAVHLGNEDEGSDNVSTNAGVVVVATATQDPTVLVATIPQFLVYMTKGQYVCLVAEGNGGTSGQNRSSLSMHLVGAAA